MLKSLAYEGETAGIRRVMDRLLLLSYHLSDLDHRKGQGRSHKRLKGHHNLALMEEKQSVMNSSTQSIRSGFTGLDGNNNTSQKIELDLPNQLAPYKAADGYNGGVDTQFNRQKIAADPNGKRRTRIENIVLVSSRSYVVTQYS